MARFRWSDARFRCAMDEKALAASIRTALSDTVAAATLSANSSQNVSPAESPKLVPAVYVQVPERQESLLAGTLMRRLSSGAGAPPTSSSSMFASMLAPSRGVMGRLSIDDCAPGQ